MRSKLSGKLVKVFLPVLGGLLIPFLYNRISLLLNPSDPYKDGNGAIGSEWVFNDILFPIIVVILLLLQWLIILPLWDKIILKFRNVLLSSIGGGIALSVIAGVLLGHIFWAKQFGLRDLGISILILSSIITVYSVANILTLYFLDKSYISDLSVNIFCAEKMKKLLKIILPPFVGFAVYFAVIRYSSFYFSLRIDEMGEGNLLAFMAYYRYLLPLLFTVSVLTQLLIIIPIWRNVINKSTTGKVWAAVLLVLVCLLFAAGISYAIWDKPDGVHHLLMLFSFMTAVQLVYWIMNLAILRLLN